jgi:hypothetical protein
MTTTLFISLTALGTVCLVVFLLRDLRKTKINTTEPCDACAADCPQCNHTGTVGCLGHRCGGRGYIPLETHHCNCKQETGNADPQCVECGGTGERVVQKAECLCCHGSKTQACPLCLGTKKYSTGRLNGAPASVRGAAEPPDCPVCNGSGRKQEVVARKDTWRAFSRSKLRGRMV